VAILLCDSSSASEVTTLWRYTNLFIIIIIIIIIINCNTYFRTMPFSDIHISQGSVATCLKRGGIFKHEFVANLIPSLLVKKF